MTNFARASSAFVAGTTITASATNDNWSGLETFLNTTGVHVYQAGTIETAALGAGSVTAPKVGLQAVASVTSNSLTGTTTSTTVLDGSGTAGIETNTSYLDVVAASSRITAVVAGLYLCLAHVTHDGKETESATDAMASLVGKIYVNGVANTSMGTGQFSDDSSAPASVSRSVVLSLTAAQYVQLGAYHTFQPDTNGSMQGHLTMIYIGPAS